MKAIVFQTVLYGAIRGGPTAIRLAAFFVGAALLDAPALAALGTLHASIDLVRVFADLGLDTFSIRRFAQRPGSFARLLPSLVLIKTTSFALIALTSFLLLGRTFAMLGWDIVLPAYVATISYCVMGIVISYRQSLGRLHDLFFRFAGFYGLTFAAIVGVYLLRLPLHYCYVVIAASEVGLMASMLWDWRSGIVLRVVPPRAIGGLLLKVLPIALTLTLGITYQRVDFFVIRAYLPADAAATYALMQRLLEPALFALAALSVTLFAYYARTRPSLEQMRGRLIVLIPGIFATGAGLGLATFALAAQLGATGVKAEWQACIAMSVAIGLKGACLAVTALIQSRFSFWMITTIAALITALYTIFLFAAVPGGGLLAAATSQVVTDSLNLSLQIGALMFLIRRSGKRDE